MVLDAEQIDRWEHGTQVAGNPRGTWSQTHSGCKYYPLDPDPDLINLIDIAHQLSLVNRFCGATMYPYSVAQHSLLCAALSQHMFPGDTALRKWALLHDAPEYVLGDMVRPVKVQLPEYRRMEQRLMEVIATKFALSPLTPTGDAALKRIDNTACVIEKEALLPFSDQWFDMPPPLEGFAGYVAERSWREVRNEFLRELIKEFV